MRRKPLIYSDKTPEDILGKNMAMVEAHFTLSLKESDPERWERMIQKKFTESERQTIADLYLALREIGVWPKSVDHVGNIKWGIAVQSDLYNMVESFPLVPKAEAMRTVDLRID